MQDFFDIPDNNEIRESGPKDSLATVKDESNGFFDLPKRETQKQDFSHAQEALSNDDTGKNVRIKKELFEQMKASIIALSSELKSERLQNEQFADFLMRVTYTLRDVPDKQTELKSLLDFVSKYLTFKDGKFSLELMSLVFNIRNLPKEEFATILGAINFQAWNGFRTEGVLSACRDNGIAFPDIMPTIELVKAYIPAEILEKLNKQTHD